MSYILDALKKAEAERESEGVPGLGSGHSSQSTYISYQTNGKPWWIVALVLGVMLCLLLALWIWRQPGKALATEPVAATPAAQPGSSSASQPAVAPALALRAAAPVASAGPADGAPASRLVVSVVVKPGAAAPAATPAAPSRNPAAAASGAGAAGAGRTAAASPPPLHELPAVLRSQIPPLNISGAAYSDSPPEWTLIINDQLMSRGSQITPELRLEEITASSAVFNFKGQRFRVDR